MLLQSLVSDRSKFWMGGADWPAACFHMPRLTGTLLRTETGFLWLRLSQVSHTFRKVWL